MTLLVAICSKAKHIIIAGIGSSKKLIIIFTSATIISTDIGYIHVRTSHALSLVGKY